MKTKHNRMNSETAKKRKRDGLSDEEGSGGGGMAAMEKIIGEMKARMARMQNELDETKGRLSRLDELERKSASMQEAIDKNNLEISGLNSRLSHMDGVERKCQYLDARCGSLERTARLLIKNGEWEYSAPPIPSDHWVDQDFDEQHIEGMTKFLKSIKGKTRALRGGICSETIRLGGFDESDHTVLLHDNALLPHWVEFTDALQLCLDSKASHRLSIYNIQLPSSVINLLTSALKNKPIFGLQLDNNEFVNIREGTEFVIEIIQSNQKLKEFHWTNNEIESMDDANLLVEAIISRPLIKSISLVNCFGENMDAYSIFRSLLASGKDFAHIDLGFNNIRTGGGTELPDFLATNPPLKDLFLIENHLDDSDAILIARALKRNTHLEQLILGGNDITDIGRDALRNSLLDSTTLNTIADSNHSCNVGGIDLDDDISNNNRLLDDKVNRGRKMYSLLSSRNREGVNVHHLFDEEFDDDSMKLVPKVLECVHIYAGHIQRSHDLLSR